MAWGRSFKDAYQRYHAMNGRELRYQKWPSIARACGLKSKLKKDLKLRSKRDIEETSFQAIHSPGVDRFVNLCKQTRRQVRQDPNRNNPSAWAIGWDLGISLRNWLKSPDDRPQLLHDVRGQQLHDLELPQKDSRSVVSSIAASTPMAVGCPRFVASASGQMEMNEGYRNIAHSRCPSLRFPLRETTRTKNLAFVWTTTPVEH